MAKPGKADFINKKHTDELLIEANYATQEESKEIIQEGMDVNVSRGKEIINKLKEE
jgi:hypothetical protein